MGEILSVPCKYKGKFVMTAPSEERKYGYAGFRLREKERVQLDKMKLTTASEEYIDTRSLGFRIRFSCDSENRRLSKRRTA